MQANAPNRLPLRRVSTVTFFGRFPICWQTPPSSLTSANFDLLGSTPEAISPMQNRREDRTCPKCNTRFVSVQSLGVCPNCNNMFRVDEYGNPLRRSFILSVLLMFSSVAVVLWILFWLFVMPVWLVCHFGVNGFMWFDWLVVAITISLIVFGRKRGLDRRLIVAATPTTNE